MPHDLNSIRAHCPDARQDPDGSITFECPVCRGEGHHGKRARLYAYGALSCVRFAAAGADANRDHCAPLRETLGLGAQPVAFILETLFDGTLTLECEPAERGKARLVARNCASVLGRDVIDLDRVDHRAQFVKWLPDFDDGQRSEIHQALLRLADRFDSVQAAIDDEDAGDKPTVKVISKMLDDGRILEQIAGGKFAVYDPQRGDVTTSSKVETDEAIYRPLDDDFILKGGLFLPDRLIEYGDDATLDAEIDACIRRYSDVPERERGLSARYARLTYIADKLNEISYLRAIGERGSGKSRYISNIGMLCLRPVLVTSPSAASLFRMMDAYQPTLTIDECNMATDSEDTQTLVQILNSGFQRVASVPRVEKGADGQQTIRMFSPFGPKLIGGLKLSESEAFESRCVAVKLQKTGRKDIPFRMTARMLTDFADLRAKLYLWRLRNLGRDIEAALDQAEAELKNYQIEPRFIQIAIPIYGMIADIGLKKDFAAVMESRTDDAAEEKKEGFAGRIVELVHSRLFDVDDDGKATWKVKGDLPELVEGEPCEGLRVGFFVDCLNEGLPEKKKFDPATFSRRHLQPIGFTTRKLKKGAYKRQAALVYGDGTFASIFKNFSLPVPEDFAVSAVSPRANADSKDFAGGRQNLETETENSCRPSANTASKELAGIETAETAEIPEPAEESFQEAFDASAVSLVALDTETEPFDEKRGIGHRNARMIGLALSFDGEGKTDYVTDPEAWPMLMPEPETVVVMHNAKFDLGVLNRTGLPVPARWEDTLIAAHLLDETGEHGLKPLAKKRLDIDDPTTFEEADRMRLLDPEVFNEYARNDARYTFRLWPQFQREMERQRLMDVYRLEKAVLPVVMAMEAAGMKLDLAQMGEMRQTVQIEADAIEAEVYDHAGCRFDLHSPQKVGAILFDKLGVPSKKETNGGQRSTDREALEDVRGYHPAVDAILRFKEIDKLASTFLGVLPAFADGAGRIHPEFKQLGATSGRFSCSNPNVQQIPSRSELGKKLRRMFVADEGNALVVADWSQMELRILAQYSKDPLLLSAYQSGAETDLHTLTAARMFGKAEADVSKPERAIAKMVNFGVSYGITPVGLFNRLRPQGVDVALEDCERFIADYFKAYAGVRRFLDRVEPRLRERGYVKNWFGRRRRVSGRTAREVRQAQNFIIQSTAADMAKCAMVRLHNSLPEGARLIAMVHDEFIVECRRDLAEDVRALMVEAMQAAPEGFIVPMVVEAKIADNWGEAK
jgi:DNA polymerase I-like protein with 3'-5' exonuclease and polymerase domains